MLALSLVLYEELYAHLVIQSSQKRYKADIFHEGHLAGKKTGA